MTEIKCKACGRFPKQGFKQITSSHMCNYLDKVEFQFFPYFFLYLSVAYLSRLICHKISTFFFSFGRLKRSGVFKGPFSGSKSAPCTTNVTCASFSECLQNSSNPHLQKWRRRVNFANQNKLGTIIRFNLLHVNYFQLIDNMTTVLRPTSAKLTFFSCHSIYQVKPVVLLTGSVWKLISI